jgi:hypothetical protein
VPEIIGDHYVLSPADKRSGGLSTVRKAMDTRDFSPVAVKFVVCPSDELSRKVFERETRTLRALSHKNIVGFRDSGVDEAGTHYLVLDWVEDNLFDLLRARGPWTEWDSLYRDFARPLLDGLSHAHLNQVEHRDIKPGNILVGDDGAPLIADFGIAKLGAGEDAHSELTVQGFKSGIYAPPEPETPIRYVRDVYSVGVLLIRCMSEESISDLAELERALDAAPVSPDVRDVLASCIHVDPYERPKNASELSALLARLASQELARRERPSNPVWLQLTHSAQVHLVGEDGDRGRAAARVVADLSGEVFAAFATDRETGRSKRDVVLLLGAEHRYTLKLDGARWVVTGARTPEIEQLEGGRRHSLQLPPIFDWTTHQPGDSAACQRSVDSLLRLLDEFHEGGEQPSAAGSEPGDDAIFGTWLSILDAREELSRGGHEPLKYKSCTVKGRRAVFTLCEVSELDLIGTDWEVFDPQTEHRFGRGEIIDQEGDKVTLLSWVELRSQPARATLRPYDGPSAVALRRQRTALEAVRAGATPGPHLRRILVNPGVNQDPSPVEVEDWSLDLDDTKKSAVRAALGAKQALVVQGPPGTGKTSFITETVIQFLRQQPTARVLIASQTHVAVDNAVERLHAAGVQGLVRLAGADDSAVQAGARELLLDRQLRSWAEGVRKCAEASMTRLATAQGVSPQHLRAALVLEQLAAVARRLEMVREQVRGMDEESGGSSELATAVEGEDPRERYQADLDQLTHRRGEMVALAQRELAGDLTISADIDSEQARNAVEVLLGDEPEVRALLRLVELQANWLERISSEASLAPVFLSGTSVIAGTCTGFLRLPAVAELEFDLCIVDEASKATLTEAVVPMARAKRWILVGDTNQLPPTDEDLLRSPKILEEHGVTKEQVTETLFQRMVHHLPTDSQLMLTEQYRMIRPIGNLISSCFYEGKLRSPRTEGLEGYDRVVGAPVTWLDTGSLGDQRREQAAGTSRANRTEARLLAEQLVTIDGAVDFGVIKPSGDSKIEVLVIAPYKSQVEELRRQVLSRSLPHLDVAILSVDAVQGREADLALLSITRSNPQGELGFLGAEYWRRINVALSRARFGLSIVGDADFIRGTRGALRNVLEYVDQHPADCTVKAASHD